MRHPLVQRIVEVLRQEATTCRLSFRLIPPSHPNLTRLSPGPNASGEILDLPALNPQTELSIQVLDEAAMQTLNHQFRNKNKPTNVLSFPTNLCPVSRWIC